MKGRVPFQACASAPSSQEPVSAAFPRPRVLPRLCATRELEAVAKGWHTDLSYTSRPAKGAILHCKEKPPVGGDTMWANLDLALETLSPGIRRLIDELEALHDVTLIRGIEQRDATIIAEMKTRNPPVIHPVVRTHPETGHKSLFVNQRIRRVIGMSDEESQSLHQAGVSASHSATGGPGGIRRQAAPGLTSKMAARKAAVTALVVGRNSWLP